MTAAEIANQFDQLAAQGWTIQTRATETGWVAQAVSPGQQSYSGSGQDFKAMGADLLSKAVK